VVIFEDLHWIDAETQELLDLLVYSVASARILMLVNYRPEYHHAWGNRTCYTSCASIRWGVRAPTRCFMRCSAGMQACNLSNG
jgi:hypothetical protein